MNNSYKVHAARAPSGKHRNRSVRSGDISIEDRYGPLQEVVTDFSELDPGYRIEAIEDPKDASKTLLAIYNHGRVSIDKSVECRGRLFVPRDRKLGVFSHIRLPKGIAAYGEARSLFTRIGAVLCACLDIDPEPLELICFFILSSWFPEKLPVAPYLAVVGTPRSGKTTLLRLLGLLCRHSILVSDISCAAAYDAYQNTIPTLLIDETHTAADQKKLMHLLRSGSTPGFVALRRGSFGNCYGPKAFAWTQLPSDQALNTRCIVIPMHETDRGKLVRPTDPRIVLEAEKLQKQLLQFRLEKYNALCRANRLDTSDASALHSRERDLYEALSLPIADDQKLCEILAWQLARQRQFTREPLSSRQAAVLAALANAVHSGEQFYMRVGAVATTANELLKRQHERIVLTPHATGDILTSLGIERKRTNKGWAIGFEREIQRKTHLLIRRYGVDCELASTSSFEVSSSCEFCRDLLQSP
jgi:hypothetical protein